MGGKLAEQGQEHVCGEDVGVRALWGQLVERLGVGNDEEQHCAEHAHDRRLEVPQLDALPQPHIMSHIAAWVQGAGTICVSMHPTNTTYSHLLAWRLAMC